MLSMTGFGRGECSDDGHRITVQVTSYNRKQTDIRLSLARELQFAEKVIWQRVSGAVRRGAVQVRADYQREAGADRVQIDADVARNTYQQLQTLQQTLNLTTPPTIDTLLTVPGIIQVNANQLPADALQRMTLTALDAALNELTAMKAHEGAVLKDDIGARLMTLVSMTTAIDERTPNVTLEHYRRMRDRVSQLIATADADDERLLKELALFADRCDISEELTRLNAHLAQMDELVSSEEPIGRKFDFLIQEVNREINTIGAKCNDRDISSHVVDFKTEVERIREQIQNIE